MQGLLKKIKSFVAAGLVTIVASCSDIRPTITQSDLEKAFQTYSQRVESEAIEQTEEKKYLERERIRSSIILSYLEDNKTNEDNVFNTKEKQTTIVELLIPHNFSIQLNAPYYSLAPEKREVRFWNNIINHLGYKGKIKSFSDRTIENAFLELEGEYFFSRFTKEDWAKRTSLGLKFSYGKDTVNSHLTHPILPPLNVGIRDELLGVGLNLNYYPRIKLKDIQLRLTTGIDYKHLNVDVDPRFGPFKIEGFDSDGCGLGYYLRLGLEPLPGKIKILPKDTTAFLAIEYRYEKIHTDPESENIGPGIIFGIKKSLR